MRRRRKHALWIAIAALVMAAGTTAQAQVYHQHPGAPVVGGDEASVGATVGLGEDLVRILGYGRFNVNEVSDLGVELLLDHIDAGSSDGWRFGMGADYKYAIVPTETELPVDLSVNAGIGFETGADLTNLDIPIGAVVSRPLELNGGRIVEPYGAIYMLITHVSVDTPPGVPDASDTDFDVELRFGASVEVMGGTSAFATVHVGHGEMFFLGVNASL